MSKWAKSQGSDSDNNKRVQRAKQSEERGAEHEAAHKGSGSATSAGETTSVQAYSGSLLGDARLNGRGNAPVRAATMQRMQQTQGNRALQRFLHGSGIPGFKAVQREGEAAVAPPEGSVASADGNPVAPPDAGTTTHPTVKTGSKGPAVEELQQKLNADGATPALVADGIFGPKTRAAAVAFQSKHGLDADGIVGPITWGKLDELGHASDVGRVEKDWSELVGGQTYGMTSRYTWRITGTEIKVTVKLKFTGEKRDDLVTQWMGYIQSMWNRFDATNDAGEKIAIVFDPQSVKGGEDNAVEIMAGNGRSNAAQWFADDPDSNNTAAHEFGHMIGLEDEYQRAHGDYKRLVGKDPEDGETTNATPAATIATEMHTALQEPDEPTRVTNATGVVTTHDLKQGKFAQEVATAYQAAFGVEIVKDIVDHIPDEDEWDIVDPFTHSSQSLMGMGGNHAHPLEPRHVREFVGYVGASKGGKWKAVER